MKLLVANANLMAMSGRALVGCAASAGTSLFRGITEYRIQNTEYRIQNTEYRIQNTEYGIRKTEYGIRKVE